MSASGRLTREKEELRSRVLERRNALAEAHRVAAERAIFRELLALPEMRPPGTVMLFSSFGSEVGTAPIVDRLLGEGRVVVLPRVEDRELVAVRFDRGVGVARARLGMLEPTDGAMVDATDVDVVVTPGIAFDRSGYRVGYGGGFYDRFFARARPDVRKIAVCFRLQVVDAVPHGATDVAVDVLVTEGGVIRCR